jgi:hypothetical protein
MVTVIFACVFSSVCSSCSPLITFSYKIWKFCPRGSMGYITILYSFEGIGRAATDWVFLIGIVGGVVQLGPLGTAATNRPIVPPCLGYHLAHQENPRVLWKTKLHSMYRRACHWTVLKQFNTVNVSTPYITSILVFSSFLSICIPVCIFPWGFWTKILYAFPISLRRAICFLQFG